MLKVCRTPGPTLIIVCMKIIVAEQEKMAELEGDDNPTENSSSESELISKKNVKALVWKHFGFNVDANGQLCSMEAPKCRLCHHTVA